MFIVSTSKSKDKNKLKFVESGEFDFIGRTSVNYGVQGHLNKLEYNPNPENTFSLSQVGETVALFRKKAWYGSQNMFVLTPKQNGIVKNHMFFESAFYRVLRKYSDAYTYPVLDDVKQLIIKLPEKDGQIDYDFMKSFIQDIKNVKLVQLKEYLKNTNQINYELTDNEMKILNRYKNGGIKFKEFAFDEIFNNIKQGRRLKKDDQKDGNIAFVMSGITNNGVVGFISNPVASFPRNSITIDIFGNSFYRNYDFGAGDDTGVYWNDEIKYTVNQLLFLTSAMYKALKGKFDFGKKLRSSQSKKIKMSLPSKCDVPDFDMMELIISAIRKIMIKSLVDFSNNCE